MEFVNIIFYLFSLFLIAASIAVVASRNPVHSVLWLIFAFFNAAGLFVILGAEMLAMLLVIVYVGAVAVLFLFVVMMLNIKTSSLKNGFQAYLPLGLILALILFLELAVVILNPTKKIELSAEKTVATELSATQDANVTKLNNEKLDHQVLAETTIVSSVPQAEVIKKPTNAKSIGLVLYTKYILYFQASGLILLVAMIGAIVLTLRHRDGVRRQKAAEQNTRINSIKLVKVESGKGIE